MTIPPKKPDSVKQRKKSAEDIIHEELAETQVFENVEARRGRVRTASGEVYRTAVAGERPVLSGNVGLEQMFNLYGTEGGVTSSGRGDSTGSGGGGGGGSGDGGADGVKKTPRFKDIARRVMEKNTDQQTSKSNLFANAVTSTMAQRRRRHKRSATAVQNILESIAEDTYSDLYSTSKAGGGNDNKTNTSASAAFFEQVGGDEPELGKSEFAVEDTQVDRLVRGAMQVEKLLEESDDDSTVGGPPSVISSTEELPLLETDRLDDELDNNDDGRYGATTPNALREQLQRTRVARQRRKWYRKLGRKVARCCNPMILLHMFINLIKGMYYTWFALPLFVFAWICFYQFGNPHFDFMPGPATLSWWSNFFGRQLLTLELARLTQFILIDWLILGNKYTVQLLGPLVTLWSLQAKGWPLLVITWGIWDLLLLHGDNTFQTHWFNWTGLAIYSNSKANSGSYILYSSLYLRTLISLIIAGTLTSVKRAAVAIYFGRRTFSEFKPRLEQILKDIVLLNDISDLAEEAERITSEMDVAKFESTLRESIPQKDTVRKTLVGSVSWDEPPPMLQSDPSMRSIDGSGSLDTPPMSDRKMIDREPSNLSRSVSGSIRIKHLLDRWEEPVNKLDKTSDASIHDILRFRRALAFMDEDRPFGDSYGDASTRDECIESAHHVYVRLLKLTPDQMVLSNDVLVMLAQEEDGTINDLKQAALRRLFRPDRFDQIPLLAFIQSCDTLYRKLRYFRASVGNASVIDHVLERMIDGAFGFLVFLIILSVLDVNFWPLLVSMSTLFVSFSFAMGSSASKYIEGILLIAVRRPYDLGDRIVFTSADLVTNPGAASSWIVEDINLYATTLRFAFTNEVATVSNGAISAARVCNLNRSPNAICTVALTMHICIIEEDRTEIFKTAIEKYVSDNPRVWESLVNFRFNSFDSDNEKTEVFIQVRHRNSWQDAPRVLRDFGDFQRFIYKLGSTMRINFDSPPQRRLLYQGGTLMSGQVEDYKRNLLKPTNIKNYIKDEEPKPVDRDISDTIFLAQLQKSNEGA